MNYIPSIPDWFKTRKAAQVAAFFAAMSGGKINILKVVKLIYLSDRLSMERRDAPITNDQYVSMDFGPVNSSTYNYMKGLADHGQDEWHEFIGIRNGNDLPLSREISIGDDLDELSRSEVKILYEVWEKFEDIDRFDLAEWTHEFCPEWVFPHGSSIPIDYATIFAKLGKSDPVSLAEDLQAERRLTAELAAEK
ncbi:Panacea domain-containing protein [Rhizobium sp. LjRoot254]|uniref:Panacea domain-containing protein n=1 Tax=Rhizobium sp. LjRoot254 TaxID=3342297 RepID=UPI003ED02B76